MHNKSQFRSGTNENVRGNTTATATAPQLYGEIYVCIIALHRMVYGLRYLPNGWEAMMVFRITV